MRDSSEMAPIYPSDSEAKASESLGYIEAKC